MSTNRPTNGIPGAATTPATPPTLPGGPPIASPPPDLGSPDVDEARDAVCQQADFLADVAAGRRQTGA